MEEKSTDSSAETPESRGDSGQPADRATTGSGTDQTAAKGQAADRANQNFVLIQTLSEKHPMLAETLVDLEACADVFKRLVKHKAGQEPPKSEAVYIPPVEAHARASTCPAKWDDMSGTDRFRLCSECKLYMYDFTGMTRQQAEAEIFRRENREGDIKFYKRIDKRFLTKDCPIGARKLREQKLFTLGLVLFGGTIMVGICWQHKSEYASPQKSVVASSLPGPASHRDSSIAEQTRSNPPSATTQSSSTQYVSSGSALSQMVPQKDGHPVTFEGQIIPEGSRYVTRYTRMEFLRGSPRGAENLPLTDDRLYSPNY